FQVGTGSQNTLASLGINADKVIFVDVNGDGITDILSAKNFGSGENLALFINRGTEFDVNDIGIPAATIFSNIVNSHLRRTSWARVSDINGDGLKDIIYPVF